MRSIGVPEHTGTRMTIGLPGEPGRPIALDATEIAGGHYLTVMDAKSGTPKALTETGLTFSDQPIVVLP